MQPTELVTLNMRELDRLKVIQAVVDRMLKPGLAAEHAILLLGITCGMRVTEIARVEVADMLTQSGVVRTEVSLRAAITKGYRQRCIYVTHEKTRAALAHNLAYRTFGESGSVP